jgi:hypothetical protein
LQNVLLFYLNHALLIGNIRQISLCEQGFAAQGHHFGVELKCIAIRFAPH